MSSVADNPLATTAAAGSWTCPTCNNVYPNEFSVCPRDATPRTELAPAIDPLIGEVLGRTYRIVRVLGEGGMARLYEAEHLRIEARYAVKVIHDDLSRDPALLARFEREARAAARIHSEHVVQLVDVLRTQDNRPCMVTELLEGEDLQALLDRVKKLAVAEAIPIARQICRAVAAAHAVGVVHRDLKPANVFLCGKPVRAGDGAAADLDGRGLPPAGSAAEWQRGSIDDLIVKVFDFGVAKVVDDDLLTRSDAVMGTAAYMAPEQARSAADAGPLADVYSTSAVLYHMLTGHPPYGNVPAFSRLAMVLHEEPARPRSLEPSIPAGVEAVIQHAMARDPATRIQSAGELEAQLAAFDQPAPSSAPAETPATRRSLGGSGGGLPTVAGDAIATQIAARARLARPLTAFVAAASSIMAGAWLAALLAVVVVPQSRTERVLIGIMGIGTAVGIAALHIRALRKSWRSAPAVLRYIRPAARSLVIGTLTFGTLELIAAGSEAVFSAPPFAFRPRLIITGVAAALGLGWQTLRLDDRLRRWIG